MHVLVQNNIIVLISVHLFYCKSFIIFPFTYLFYVLFQTKWPGMWCRFNANQQKFDKFDFVAQKLSAITVIFKILECASALVFI